MISDGDDNDELGCPCSRQDKHRQRHRSPPGDHDDSRGDDDDDGSGDGDDDGSGNGDGDDRGNSGDGDDYGW